MNHQPTIQAVCAADIPDVLTFTLDARAELFPKLSATGTPDDLARFAEVYLHGEGCFLIARHEGQIVASIGYLPYDRRFPALTWPGLKVVEVVRLFVVPSQRRSGLAGSLYRALKAHAVANGVELIYLHTHPFLPGAIEFWQRQGFEIVQVDEDPVWQTTHMQSFMNENAESARHRTGPSGNAP
ncbi:GNAT family N-acetyltransferase [Pseudomonas sp. SWRI153]|uniref:GNAT family N-acetyltransferase n=1 Tax=Pseudomonas khorasanensis TaxID=2745508 RepID=A0A923F822_9PSED|nr:GNAT family N-acetyltransferase [Pseudomonas khorasanensis]MBV4487978.1 GNAT family N-acetyltransferase [Pseudomonas khorasanensis]